MLDFGDLLVVQSAGALLALSADERNGAALFEKHCAILYLPVLHLKGIGYIIYV